MGSAVRGVHQSVRHQLVVGGWFGASVLLWHSEAPRSVAAQCEGPDARSDAGRDSYLFWNPLFPKETRDAVDVKPAPVPEPPPSLLARLRAPWNSLEAQRLPAAVDLVRCAAVAYETPKQMMKSISQLGSADHEVVRNGPAKGVVMIDGTEAVIAFEGTNGLDDIGDWFANLDTSPDSIAEGVVHGVHAPELRSPAVVRLLADTQPSADIGHGRTLPKVNISLPKKAHDLLCTASLFHPRTLSSPTRGTRILSQDPDQDLGRGSILINSRGIRPFACQSQRLWRH
jgi:hypothetical protein